MRNYLSAAKRFFSQADIILLCLCCAASIFGLVMITSATSYTLSDRFFTVQLAAIILGVLIYVLLSFIDIDIITDKWELLIIFNLLFIGSLYFIGTEGDTGNKSWIRPSFLPIGIQPAEICKITYILIMSKMMTRRRERLSSPVSMLQFLGVTLVTVAVIILSSDDAGMAIVYIFIFFFLAICAGVKPGWFIAGFASVLAAAPFVWTRLMRDDQKERLLVIFDSTIDPQGLGVRWQMAQSEIALGAGQLLGQGYGSGAQTQTGSLPAQHTDFIFSVIGEELGFIGCVIALLLLALIIARCFYVGVKSNNYCHRLICCGIASMLMFQIFVNVGMCLGLVPIIGLTLPFFSYGGSSIVTMFTAMGLVSSIKMRPSADTPIKYVHPPLSC